MSYIRIILVVLIGTLWLPAAHAGWGSGHPTPCQQTADKMFVACRFDVQDDYFEALANCKNLGGAGARSDCFSDARATRREEGGACGEIREARRDACDILGEKRYAPDPLAATAQFIDPDLIPGTYAANPYVSLEAGHTFVLKAGEEGEETIVVHVTDETREILGVPCRVIVDIVVEESFEDGEVEYEAVEVTDDWMAQKVNGDVVYCGEIARNYEDGVLRNLDGSFEAGMDFAKAGILFMNDPVWGLAHRQEFALGEAEDIVQYLDLATMPTAEEGGDNENFPCAPNQCVKALEFAPLEPESAEYKYYLPGTGFVLAVAMEDDELTGEREELVCIGDSLNILESAACGIADSEALLEELCTRSPDAFCED